MNSSAQAAPTVPKRRWFDRRTPLPSEVGQHRTTAFIYGNILVLAAVVQVSLHPITGRSVVTVLATAVTTFLAHVFADVITSTWSVAHRAARGPRLRTDPDIRDHPGRAAIAGSSVWVLVVSGCPAGRTAAGRPDRGGRHRGGPATH